MQMNRIKTHTIVASISLTLAAVPLVGCDSGGEGLEDGPGAFAEDFRTSDTFFTWMDAARDGQSPHGVARIWYSSNIRSLEGQTGFEVPVGTVAIKEFDMDKDGTLDGLAVMIKREAGFDAANGDWYYDMRDLAGVVDPASAGANPMCIGCHSAAKSTLDYLPGFTLR